IGTMSIAEEATSNSLLRRLHFERLQRHAAKENAAKTDNLSQDAIHSEVQFSQAYSAMPYFERPNDCEMALLSQVPRRSLAAGEILFPSFAALVQDVNKGGHFIDLGSGTGRAVVAWALLRPEGRASGVEIREALHLQALEVSQRLTLDVQRRVHLHCGDLFHFGLEDADIILVNSTGFDDSLMGQISRRLAEAPGGCRVVLLSQPLPKSDGWSLVFQAPYRMSWGNATAFVYERHCREEETGTGGYKRSLSELFHRSEIYDFWVFLCTNYLGPSELAREVKEDGGNYQVTTSFFELEPGETAALLLLLLNRVSHPAVHRLLHVNDKVIEDMAKRLGQLREAWVLQQEKLIRFGADQKWADVEADEATFDKKVANKQMQWEQWKCEATEVTSIAMSQKLDWPKALHVFWSMASLRLEHSVASYNAAIPSDWKQCVTFIDKMRSGVGCDAVSLTRAAETLREGQWPLSLHHLLALPMVRLQADAVSCSGAIQSCMASERLEVGHWAGALHLREVAWNHYCYNAFMKGCERWCLVLGLFGEMLNTLVQPDVMSQTLLVSSWGEASAWKRILDVVQRPELPRSLFTYNTVMHAFVENSIWSMALTHFGQLYSRSLQADKITFTIALKAQSSRWQRAVAQLDEVVCSTGLDSCNPVLGPLAGLGKKDSGTTTDYERESACFCALRAARKWRETILQLEQMGRVRLSGQRWSNLQNHPGQSVAYNAAVDVFDQSSCWREGLQFLGTARAQDVLVDAFFFSSLLTSTVRSMALVTFLALVSEVKRLSSLDAVASAASIQGLVQATNALETCWWLDHLQRLGYCASTPPDWSGEQSSQWPGRHPEVYTPFREGRIRAERLRDPRNRGLCAGRAVKAGDTICSAQPPLSLLQYSDSRSLCEVCAHCRRFCGSLATALRRCLRAVNAGDLEDYLDDPKLIDQLEQGDWHLRGRLPCEHCDVVFCSEECFEAGQREGWHRVLCTDLTPEKRTVWKCFRQYAGKYHEQFVAAAQVIAEIISLVEHHGIPLWEAMAYFSRFMKMSWLNMQSLPSMSMCQAGPVRGSLAAMAQGKREKRQQVMLASLELLVAILWEERWSELLSLDYYSNLVGQFSLSNVWVQMDHPLNDRLREMQRDPSFRHHYDGLLRACQEAMEKVKALAEDSEPENPEETGPSSREKDMTFSLPRFEGSALYPCVALSNHSCIPNFTMRYHDGSLADMVALRDIQEGDELNLAYVSPSTPLPERVASLWKNWGFVCTCRRCQDEVMIRAVKSESNETKSGDDISASDLPPGIQLSPAGIAAAMAVRRDKASYIPPEDDTDDATSSDESTEEDEDEEDAGVDHARNAPFSGPFGSSQIPRSVTSIEAAMREMIADLGEDA
ncbi:Histone-lysine N-methyltransferase ATXR2 (Protein SET DOMAIN GROUP 36) (Trithorax-related protein 2) (TRX-related protein 2), partial [Durusdinium trenchii]